MKNNKKKGFTLVELLVVIAILAILATVSILGYTSFTGKAKASNAEQELAQMKTMFLADWLDGFVGEAKDEHAIIKQSTGNKGYKFDEITSEQKSFEELVKALDGKDVTSDLAGRVYFEVTKTTRGTDPVINEYEITAVKYASANGYVATWDIANDTISAVQGTKPATWWGKPVSE